jgi:transposase
MRALKPDVMQATWEMFEAVLPEPPVDTHPLGRHRRRIPDRVCFQGILTRLVTGSSWEDIESVLGHVVSDTTLRARRDEWVAAGVFDLLCEMALSVYDDTIALDMSDVAVDGSLHKAPCGGEGTGPNPCDRAKSGWKWSIATDSEGIPVGWVVAAANRNDSKLLEATLEAVDTRGLLNDIGTLHLDRGYDNRNVNALCDELGITDRQIARQRRRGEPKPPTPQPLRLGRRWTVERTNSWLSNFGQLRRNTDRRIIHRHAQIAFAVALLLIAKVIDWHKRADADPPPIR